MVRDLDAADEFHDEERPPGLRRPGIEYFCDVWMIHQSQRLALGLESGDYTPGVHAGLDDFQGNSAMNRLLLFRHEYHTVPSLANLLDQFISTNVIACFLADAVRVHRRKVSWRLLHEIARL